MDARLYHALPWRAAIRPHRFHVWKRNCSGEIAFSSYALLALAPLLPTLFAQFWKWRFYQRNIYFVWFCCRYFVFKYSPEHLWAALSFRRLTCRFAVVYRPGTSPQLTSLLPLLAAYKRHFKLFCTSAAKLKPSVLRGDRICCAAPTTYHSATTAKAASSNNKDCQFTHRVSSAVRFGNSDINGHHHMVTKAEVLYTLPFKAHGDGLNRTGGLLGQLLYAYGIYPVFANIELKIPPAAWKTALDRCSG